MSLFYILQIRCTVIPAVLMWMLGPVNIYCNDAASVIYERLVSTLTIYCGRKKKHEEYVFSNNFLSSYYLIGTEATFSVWAH